MPWAVEGDCAFAEALDCDFWCLLFWDVQGHCCQCCSRGEPDTEIGCEQGQANGKREHGERIIGGWEWGKW